MANSKITSFEELTLLRESSDLEVKKAQGRNSAGAVPDSFWETYSAMANTEGGTIVLGADEDEVKNVVPIGIEDTHKVLKTLWDLVNNPNKISVNLLHDRDVYVLGELGLKLIIVNIPRAPRSQRPVYVGQNIMRGTYRRNYEGDYRCDPETVSRMIAEANNDTRDGHVIEGYNLDDIDLDSLSAYRNDFRSTSPVHPWIQLSDEEFLRQLGGFRQDRHTGKEGLTLAGLLMFGKYRSIFDAVPLYAVDYQERPADISDDIRWTDRVTTDGTWSGNLYDFFTRAYRKLTADLKVPFRLEKASKRIDETNVHVALREALINSIVHADYTASVGILAVKQPHRFFFRNPGSLRLPLKDVLTGGVSDCRNRELQKMFRMIGAGDQAGSGMPKIMGAWKERDWRKPLIRQTMIPEQTTLEMTMQSLFPDFAVDELQTHLGDEFSKLLSDERLALVTAFTEKRVTNARLQEITDTHRTDITKMLKGLVQREFLEQEGYGSVTFYRLSDLESASGAWIKRPKGEGSQDSLFDSSETITFNPARSEPTRPTRPEPSRSEPSKANVTSEVRRQILAFCLMPKSAVEIASHLNRNRAYVSFSYLSPLIKEEKLTFLGPRYSSSVQYQTTALGKRELDENS